MVGEKTGHWEPNAQTKAIENFEVLALLATQQGKGFPEDDSRLTAGVVIASQIYPDFGILLEGEGLSEVGKSALAELQDNGCLIVHKDGSRGVSEEKRRSLEGKIKMLLSAKKRQELEEAVAAARDIWFPQGTP